MVNSIDDLMNAPLPASAAVADGLPMPRRLVAIVALGLGTMLTVIDGNIVTVALPTIARDLHVDGSAAVLVVTVYQLVLVMALLPCSALGDLIGLKRMYQYGQLLFTAATFLCFFAKSLPVLLVVRAMQGLGAAAALSMMAALIRHSYPARNLGRGLGMSSIIVSVSAASAPVAGGLILAVAPWPWLFAAGVPFAILSLWLGRAALPDVAPVVHRYNLAGALLNMATFGLLIGGIECGVHGGSPLLSLAIVILGVVFAIWFVRHERAEARPILPVDMLGDPMIGLSALGALLTFSGSMLLLLSMPFRLEQLYGFSPSEVGAVITPLPVAMMIISPLAGILSDRVRPALLGAFGMAIVASACLLLAFAPTHAGYFDFAWRMAMCGCGLSLYLAPNARLIVGSAPRHRAAAAGGLISTTRLTGQTIGATLMAILLTLGLGATVPPLLAAVFATIAGVCSLTRMRVGAVRGFGPITEIAIE
jgi:DHA2 family multidrug resistance protein-like MFS transporter